MPTVFNLLLQADRTLLLVGGRLLFALLLAAVQLYVLRAMLQIVRSMQLHGDRERTLTSVAIGIAVGVNLPLAYFIIESFLSPHRLMLYAPPIGYEAAVRPFSYMLFIWTIGSLIFAAAAPWVMACFR